MITKRAQATVAPGDDPGEFDMILSNGALDRDGETLNLSDWAQPLPDTIPINANHSKDVSDIIGSGVPFFDSEGNLRVRGTFASNAAAQHIRSLVNEGHLRSVSVEFLRTEKGNVLVGGAFVNVPANPEARVLASKASNGGDGALVQAIHDAAYWLGGQCMEPDVDPDSGASSGANKSVSSKALDFERRLDAILAGKGDPGPMDDRAQKAAALRLRLKSICA